MPGHAGQLVAQAEIVLEGGGGQGLALGLNRQVLAFASGWPGAGLEQATAGHGAAGVLVDQEDLVALDDVLTLRWNRVCARSAA